MIVTKQVDIKYEGESVTAHRINDSVTLINKHHLVLGMSLDDAKEMYDVLGRLVADTIEEK